MILVHAGVDAGFRVRDEVVLHVGVSVRLEKPLLASVGVGLWAGAYVLYSLLTAGLLLLL